MDEWHPAATEPRPIAPAVGRFVVRELFVFTIPTKEGEEPVIGTYVLDKADLRGFAGFIRGVAMVYRASFKN